MKLLLCTILLFSLFSYNIQAFEGLHQRNGVFYLVHEDKPNKLIIANELNVVWENGIVKYFTTTNGKKIRVKKNSKNSGYQEIQIIEIDTKEIVLNQPCEIHSYPLEFKEYKTGEVLKPGTYTVDKFSVGWLGILNEDGTTSWINPNRNKNYKYISGKNAYFKNVKGTLSVNKVNEISINKKYMLTEINNSVRPGYASTPQYVTIHNTGNTSNNANALTHAKLQYERQSNKNVWSSWHFQVDDHSIYQSIPMDEVSWHSGDGSMEGNTTIGIEICENSGGNYAKAEKNAAYLTAQILYELGLPKDAVKMHKDWNGKTCPSNIINKTKGSMGWEKFKVTVANYYDQLVKENRVEIVKANNDKEENIPVDIYLAFNKTNYNGKRKVPLVTINEMNGYQLIRGEDYSLKYTNNINAGNANVQITFKGNYKGTINKTFIIQSIDASDFTAQLAFTKATYNGNNKTPKVRVVDVNGNELVKGTDYTVKFGTKERKNVGRYSVTITYIGNYKGTKKLWFTITPQAPENAKAELYGKDDVKFSWSKVSGATGYNVYYKKASASTYKLAGSTTKLFYKIPNLEDGIKYTFKVVPYYKTANGTTKYTSLVYKTASVTTKK